MKTEKNCLMCGTVMLLIPSRTKQIYCSRACALADPNGAIRNLNKSRIHRITNVDEKTKLGDCAKCGPSVRVRKRTDGNSWRCSVNELSKIRVRKYGVDEETVQEMLRQQGGGCAICGRKQPNGNSNVFHVDHDHTTGQVRGILCSSCNIGIGSLGDDARIVYAAFKYLERFQPWES